MSEVISTSATLKPYAINTGQFLINGSTGTNGQAIQTTGTGIQWATLPTSQWSGTSGQPITYTPFVGIGASSIPSSNLQVTGNTTISNSLTTQNLYYYSPNVTGGSVVLPSALGSLPYAIDMVSLTMANFMPATHKTFGTQQVTTLDLYPFDYSMYGFYGAFTDGRYGYFVPNADGNNIGEIARVDLKNFVYFSGITPLNLKALNGSAYGYWGGFTDGRYGYFIPFSTGLAARVDLQNFTSSGVTFLDLTALNGNAKGYSGGFTDGRYAYFCPDYFGASWASIVTRIDLKNFAAGGVTFLDLSSVNANAVGFQGGFTDGRYGYFVPWNWSGYFTRIDLQNFTTSGVTLLSLSSINANAKGFYGGFTDGRYGYLVPTQNPSGYAGLTARVDLQNFTSSGATFLDFTAVNVNAKGYAGGFTDGRYGYFVPRYSGSPGWNGLAVRVDLQNYTTSGTTILDLTSVNSNLNGFRGGFTDGKYAYFCPYGNAYYLGLIGRVQITIPPYLYNGSI